jgi:hypothetical protein
MTTTMTTKRLRFRRRRGQYKRQEWLLHGWRSTQQVMPGPLTPKLQTSHRVKTYYNIDKQARQSITSMTSSWTSTCDKRGAVSHRYVTCYSPRTGEQAWHYKGERRPGRRHFWICCPAATSKKNKTKIQRVNK